MPDLIEKLLQERPRIRTFRGTEYTTYYSSTPHFSHVNELLYILNGQMTLHLESNLKFDATPGDLLLIPAHTKHRDEFTADKGLRVLFVQFDWDQPEFFRKVNNNALIHLDYDIRNEVRHRLLFMQEYWSNTPAWRTNASLQFHSILLLLFHGAENADRETASAIPVREAMRKTKHYIRQNYGSQITLEDAARVIGISPSYLSRLFRSEFGESFSTHLTAVRLDEAKRLLQTTSLQVAEIANLCGFTSSSYFIKVFNAHFGMTPKAYGSQERFSTHFIGLGEPRRSS